MNHLLVLCCTISGATALVLEVLWMRSAGLVLGTTASTTASVLACYFAGLGLGAGCARHMQRQPVRWYGLRELGTGIGAVWSLAVFRALASDPAQTWLVRWGPIGHVTAVSLALFPATLCMGATLPALGQALAAAESVGRRGGLLYALNTLGGVLGAAVAGFGLPALIGVRASYGVAAGTNLLVGATALIIGHGLPEGRSAREVSGTVVPALPRSRLWIELVPEVATAARTYRSVEIERLHERLRRLPEWSRDGLFTSPQGLMMLYAGDLTSVEGRLREMRDAVEGPQ